MKEGRKRGAKRGAGRGEGREGGRKETRKGRKGVGRKEQSLLSVPMATTQPFKREAS